MSPLTFVEKPVRWLRAITRYGGSLSMSPNFGYQMCVDGIPPEEREGLNLRSWRLSLTGSEAIRAQTIRNFVRTFAPSGSLRPAPNGSAQNLGGAAGASRRADKDG